MDIMTEIDHKKSGNNLQRYISYEMASQYASVEFSAGNLAYLYQFKLLESSICGMEVLVKEGSDIIKYLNVGDMLDMRYYPINQNSEIKSFRTEITHIAKNHNGRFRGHYVVGLSIVNE